jgi:hypothetical protein
VEEGLLGRGGEKVAQTMYTYVTKCKNDKIKKKESLDQQLEKQKIINQCLSVFKGKYFFN